MEENNFSYTTNWGIFRYNSRYIILNYAIEILPVCNNINESPNTVRVIKSRRLRWAGNIARKEEGRSAFKILAGKPTGKRPLGRPRR